MRPPIPNEDEPSPQREGSPLPSFAKRYSFGIAMFVAFALSLAAQFAFQVQVNHEGWTEFMASMFENWQSEFLQLFAQAGGLAVMYWWGSSQSREGDEQMQAQLNRIEALLRSQNRTE